MLVNDNIIEEFKKSLTATVKSIGKSKSIEVNFIQDMPSINGDIINLVEPNIKSLTKELNYIRAEADSMALEIRFHKKTIHDKYKSSNNITNEFLLWGSGPRASMYIVLAAKAKALISGKTSPDLDDLLSIVKPVMRHRIISSFNAEAKGKNKDQIIEDLINYNFE